MQPKVSKQRSNHRQVVAWNFSQREQLFLELPFETVKLFTNWSTVKLPLFLIFKSGLETFLFNYAYVS